MIIKMQKGRPKINPKDRKVKTCVRVKPDTLEWYKELRKEKKISMGQVLEDYKEQKKKRSEYE